MEKRTWVYVQQPKEYGIALHDCGHADSEWSEFQKHLWCPICKVDFIPEHYGVLDGPVGVNVCKAMGISFDRFNLETQQIEPFETDTKENK
jgi:hypothetical protein